MSPRPSQPRHTSRTQRPLVEELPALLAQRGWSQSELARRVQVDPTFLSRALRRVRYKSISGRLAGRIAEALDLPVDYFPEFRRDYVVERLGADGKLLDEAYAWVRRRERATKSSRARDVQR